MTKARFFLTTAGRSSNSCAGLAMADGCALGLGSSAAAILTAVGVCELEWLWCMLLARDRCTIMQTSDCNYACNIVFFWTGQVFKRGRQGTFDSDATLQCPYGSRVRTVVPATRDLAVVSAARGSSHARATDPERLEEDSTGNANARCRASAIQLCSAGVGPCANLFEPAAIESKRSPSERSRSQTCRCRCESGSGEPIGAPATGRPSRRLRRCVSSSQASARARFGVGRANWRRFPGYR